MAATANGSENSRQGPRKCKECKIILPDIYAYVDHLESKEHRKGVMKSKYGKNYLEAKAILDGERIKETSSENESSDEEDDAVYTCDVCKKICTGRLSYNLHLSGKKHQKNVQRSKLMKKLQKDKVIPENTLEEPADGDELMEGLFSGRDSSTEILCKTCNKKCPGPKAFKQHTESESHKKKLAKQKILKDLGFEKDSEEDSENEEIMKCDVCEKEFSGVIPYQQHMKSQAHQKQVKMTNQLMKLKDLLVTSDEDDKRLQCKECNKYFSGPKPFHDHLRSSLHSKMKKKSDMLNALKEKHPEMDFIATSPTENSDSEDEGMIIACTVCHSAFTGPESAKDHFESQKHKKVLKEKKRYEKLKQKKNGSKNAAKLKSEETKHEVLKAEDSESSDEFDIIG